MAKDPRIYAKALLARKPRPAPGLTAPRLERVVPPHAAAPARLARLRDLLGDGGRDHLPLTYPYVASFLTHLALMADARFPLPPMGVVHVRNTIVQRRPIGAAEPLRCVCAIDGIRVADKGLEFDLETTGYVGTDPVWHGTSTMLARSREAKDRGAPKPLTLAHPDAHDEPWATTPALARRYAWASDDLNPIHLGALTARLFGFRAPLLHGMWSVGRIAARHPELLAGGVRFDCELKKPVLLPARLTYRRWRDAGGVAVRVLDERGEVPHLVGTLTPQ